MSYTLTITLQAQGAKGTISFQTNSDRPTRWIETPEIQEDLESIVIRDVPALAVLQGNAYGMEENVRGPS